MNTKWYEKEPPAWTEIYTDQVMQLRLTGSPEGMEIPGETERFKVLRDAYVINDMKRVVELLAFAFRDLTETGVRIALRHLPDVPQEMTDKEREEYDRQEKSL